jgi:hypothetical protein
MSGQTFFLYTLQLYIDYFHTLIISAADQSYCGRYKERTIIKIEEATAADCDQEMLLMGESCTCNGKSEFWPKLKML